MYIRKRCYEKTFYFLLFRQLSLKLIDNCTIGSAPYPVASSGKVVGLGVTTRNWVERFISGNFKTIF